MQVHATDWLHNHTVTWSGDGSELFFPYHERAEVELWRAWAGGAIPDRLTHFSTRWRGLVEAEEISTAAGTASTSRASSFVRRDFPRRGMRQYQMALRHIQRWSWSTGAAPTPISRG